MTKTHDHGDDDDMDTALDTIVEYIYEANDQLLTETRDAGPTAPGGVTEGDTFTLHEWGPNADPGTSVRWNRR